MGLKHFKNKKTGEYVSITEETLQRVPWLMKDLEPVSKTAFKKSVKAEQKNAAKQVETEVTHDTKAKD